ncbi:hypothetical protein PYCCODRAFT_713969 [Trametes coccinea BRFM310]|uniref:Uncharacterized protein n=1 Tax=Trametes coccinea (strain BRFM310) TaxID=1353009 RepID=A0A1Y2IFW8_TRAC3|nr:hypothetical protein PYCCODRAFT_713969 [Trametes coccinea BRFM310]
MSCYGGPGRGGDGAREAIIGLPVLARRCCSSISMVDDAKDCRHAHVDGGESVLGWMSVVSHHGYLLNLARLSLCHVFQSLQCGASRSCESLQVPIRRLLAALRGYVPYALAHPLASTTNTCMHMVTDPTSSRRGQRSSFLLFLIDGVLAHNQRMYELECDTGCLRSASAQSSSTASAYVAVYKPPRCHVQRRSNTSILARCRTRHERAPRTAAGAQVSATSAHATITPPLVIVSSIWSSLQFWPQLIIHVLCYARPAMPCSCA